MEQSAVLFIIQQGAEVLGGGAGGPSCGAAASTTQGGKECRQRQGAFMLGPESNNRIWQGSIRVGRAFVGVGEFGEGVTVARREGLRRKGARRCGQLTEVDESTLRTTPGHVHRRGWQRPAPTTRPIGQLGKPRSGGRAQQRGR